MSQTCSPMFPHLLDTIIVAVDGRRMATCRIEQSGFEPWPGAALRCVLEQVTLLSEWSKASLHPGV